MSSQIKVHEINPMVLKNLRFVAVTSYTYQDYTRHQASLKLEFTLSNVKSRNHILLLNDGAVELINSTVFLGLIPSLTLVGKHIVFAAREMEQLTSML